MNQESFSKKEEIQELIVDEIQAEKITLKPAPFSYYLKDLGIGVAIIGVLVGLAVLLLKYTSGVGPKVGRYLLFASICGGLLLLESIYKLIRYPSFDKNVYQFSTEGLKVTTKKGTDNTIPWEKIRNISTPQLGKKPQIKN
ncbi:MAG: hypothetical protein U9O98_00155 [Asgard group archaeon]|nr:hypothetical protein [Asgard group archaeon]